MNTPSALPEAAPPRSSRLGQTLRQRLPALMPFDARRLERRLVRARHDEDLRQVESAITRAEERVALRRASVPAITYPDELPVSQRKDEIRDAIRDHQVVIVAGETGSGKTTQIPKICLELGRGITGQIGHTQPRRLAARTVAERVAEELGTELGDVVGYKVRFTDKAGDRTLVKLMTDGILLAEIAGDRDLLRYDTLIIDEAHERSLNIDFILGYLRQLLPRRPDLKVIITSATIDSERFAKAFAPSGRESAPVVEVSGRTYPVEVRYRASADDQDQAQSVSDAISELSAEGPGDILVFLSGEREIRDTTDALKDAPGFDVLPLYARLPAAEQHKVFHPTSSRRRVVLATNVAETSLTVPGIRYVIDPGLARISRFSFRTKVQRLPIEPVSQASANQRKGRCGRVADGICIRLYSQDDFDNRPEFTDPEILRTNLASVILQLSAAGLGDVRKFPFIDPPDARAITDGTRLLEELNAFKNGHVTEMGRKLARLPVDPRMGRIILEGDKNGCAREVLIVASALSIMDPRERPPEEQAAADQAHRRFAEPDSDFATFLNLWDYLGERQRELSNSAFRRMCRAEYLNYLRVREWQDLHGQLQALAGDLGVVVDSSTAERDRLHQSLLAGLLSQVGMKPEPDRPGQGGQARPGGRRALTEYLGARSARFAIFPGSSLARKPPDWVMAAELVETSRLWGRIVAKIDPDWIEPLAGHLVRRSYSEPRWEKKQGAVMATEKVTLYGIPIVADRKVNYSRIDPALSRELFIRHALVDGEWDTRHRFLAQNQRLLAEAEELEQRARRRGLVADDETLWRFYDARVPADVTSARHFDAWWKRVRHETPDLLTLTEADLFSDQADQVAQHMAIGQAYPDVWTSQSPAQSPSQHSPEMAALPLSYVFDPGTEADGVTVDIPVKTLNQARPERFSWQVPGLRAELVTELIRSLPKQLRREVGPAPDAAREVLAAVGPDTPDDDVREVLGHTLRRLRGVDIPFDAWDTSRLPSHLRITFRVTDGDRVLATGKDLAELQRQLRPKVRATLSSAAASITRKGLTNWDFGELPRVFTDGEVKAYPALADAGNTVDIRLFETQEAADAAMRAGTRRLILLTVPSPVKAIAGSLTTQAKLTLSSNPHGSVAALLADCVSCAADKLIADAGGPAWDATGFGAVRDVVRAGLHDTTAEVIARAESHIRSAQKIEVRAESLHAAVLAPAVADIRAQLRGLVHGGYLTEAGYGRLPDLVRYLLAIERRLDRLPENPGRDAELMVTVHRCEDALADARRRLPEGRRNTAPMRAVRWMIEELRVSLFAQTLGTPAPVSERRILARLQEATGG
jgi:ATP-dependent helicase HrpA